MSSVLASLVLVLLTVGVLVALGGPAPGGGTPQGPLATLAAAVRRGVETLDRLTRRAAHHRAGR